jgi:hypothetical protein
MISYLDDRSRFITGSVKIWNSTGGNAMLLLDRALGDMAFLGRFSLIGELSLSRQVEKYLFLMGIAVSWGLSILLPAFVG